MKKTGSAGKWVLAALVLGALAATPADAWAVFQLSASPRRGGQGIRFESGAPGSLLRNEEVTVTVESDLGAPYHILQTLQQPLTNETGHTIPQGAFIQFSPSSPAGNLRTQLETPIGIGQSQIYTSNTAGDSDEFVLVYNVRVPEDQPGGVYRTQMTLTAEPISMRAGVSPSIRTLEVRVEIEPKFHVEIHSERGSRGLDFGKLTKENFSSLRTLDMEIASNTGASYRIFHQLTEPLVSAQGEELDEKALRFSVRGNERGSVSAGDGIPLSQALLYSSDEWGASDHLQLQYTLEPDSSQKAGLYRGNITFRVESRSPFAPQEIIQVPVSVEVESIFSLETRFEQGAGGLNFGVFKTGEEEQKRAVTLKVRSNLGQPYQISQIVPRKMTQTEGATLPKENFLARVQAPKTGVAAGGSRPVEEGESVLFTSDKAGTPEEFQVEYALTVPPTSKAGTYSSELKYSITTL